MLKKLGSEEEEEERREERFARRERREAEDVEEGRWDVKSEETRMFTLSTTTITGLEPSDDQGTVISKLPTVM